MKHYRQTTDVTCDPACLLMAMHALDKRIILNKQHEMQIWREANLIRVPGCLPQGLALSALKRGFVSEIICHLPYMCETTKFDTISQEIAKHQEEECNKRNIMIRDKVPHVRDIIKSLQEGDIPLILVGAQKIHGIASPHWICVSGSTHDSIYFHDPLLPKEFHLRKREFTAMFCDVEHFLHRRILIIKRTT